MRFRRAQAGNGTATLMINGAACGQVEIPFVMFIISSIGPSVGYDHGSPVSEHYHGSFPFEGTLLRLDIDVMRPSGADQQNGGEVAGRSAMAQQ